MLTRVLGLTVGLLAVAASASAQVLTPPARTTQLVPIEGRITKIERARVPLGEAVTGSETRVILEFALQGCLDSLMPLISQPVVQGNRATIYVTALNAHNEASDAARCVAMPKASAQVSVPGVFQRNQIRVVFMGQQPR
ncbi:hypothetical protein [Leptolyngbya sp. FACHB-261]|uniref:hypothetical protein n=1 Tax=Leptolyngbya sp. FACHB-261 TaxID=2692806 RepID=UPI0016835851|nr:hypothetical protein [Leptolyngbya sp. FACHB-261]MBD2101102.1 hypothetical protein [Leptolyngbya sp. FACHB-261]